jgi:hypothetical protein
MQRYGHKLTIDSVDKRLVATCECGKWRRAVSLSADAVMNLVAILTGKHDRHLERLGRPSAGNPSEDALPVLRDTPEN